MSYEAPRRSAGLRARSRSLGWWIRVSIAGSFTLVVALWVDGPKVAGDTPFLLDGTDALKGCLSRHDFVGCGFTGQLNVWGLMSPIGDWPLLQHVPDLAATSLGVSAHSDRVRILVLLNVVAVVSSLLLARIVFSRTGQPAWFWAFVLVVLSGPLLGYTSYSWGETLASGVLVCFVAAALLQAHPAIVLLGALGASLTKETAYPFVAAVGVLSLLLARRRTRQPIRRHVVGGALGLALGFVFASLFNIVRFGSVLNTNYLQTELHTPGITRKLEYALGLLVAPNAGIVFFWPAAAAVLLAISLLPLAARPRGSLDPRPALVLVATIALLIVGLASWWTPFGWSAWGPRLTLPWILPLVLVALVAYGGPLGDLTRRLLVRPWRLVLVATVVIAFALPQVGYMWHPKARDEFFAAKSGPCAGQYAIGSARQYACQHHNLWFRRPMLLFGLRGLKGAGGALTSAAVAVALLGCLLLLREGLLAEAERRSAAERRERSGVGVDLDRHMRKSLYDPEVASAPRPSDALIVRFSELTEASPGRPRDVVLRGLDVLLATFFLIVSLPLAATIALAILLTSGRPLFYRGERVGRGGSLFTMLKFRTLRRGAEERLGPYLGEELVRRTKAETTRLGGWLRATQLDEIPQLWNVLAGEMSLVGPRPIRPRFFEELAGELPAYWQRLVVRPGLTGFAQVRRGYETSMAEKLAHDLEWIADRSVRLYLRTLATTAWRVLRQFVRGLTGARG